MSAFGLTALRAGEGVEQSDEIATELLDGIDVGCLVRGVGAGDRWDHSGHVHARYSPAVEAAQHVDWVEFGIRRGGASVGPRR